MPEKSLNVLRNAGISLVVNVQRIRRNKYHVHLGRD